MPEELSFSRKYRPNVLNKYIGNEKMKRKALMALTKGTRPQVIMLIGDSGCGKTTFARLLAKEYVCEVRSDEHGACGECPNCLALDDYILTGNTDMLESVRELNIADEGGKREISQIIDEMQVPAIGDAWRVFIFDECHMASGQAQNALLKIAEEPPPNVLMIFCTTNPEAIIPTLRNRSQLDLVVTKPSVKVLSTLLENVCKTEGAGYDTKGLNLVAQRNNLIIRNSLTGLENVIREKGDATYKSVVEVYEEVEGTLIRDFFRLLIGTPVMEGGQYKRNQYGELTYKRNVMAYVNLIHKIKTKIDLNSFLRSVTEFLHTGIYIINQIEIDGVSDGEMQMYLDLFGDFSTEQMCSVILKVNELGKDLETELLTLGYTGLFDENNSRKSSFDAKPKAELDQEGSQQRIIRMERQEVGLTSSIEEAKALTSGATLDDIAEMFGDVDIV